MWSKGVVENAKSSPSVGSRGHVVVCCGESDVAQLQPALDVLTARGHSVQVLTSPEISAVREATRRAGPQALYALCLSEELDRDAAKRMHIRIRSCGVPADRLILNETDWRSPMALVELIDAKTSDQTTNVVRKPTAPRRATITAPSGAPPPPAASPATRRPPPPPTASPPPPTSAASGPPPAPAPTAHQPPPAPTADAAAPGLGTAATVAPVEHVAPPAAAGQAEATATAQPPPASAPTHWAQAGPPHEPTPMPETPDALAVDSVDSDRLDTSRWSTVQQRLSTPGGRRGLVIATAAAGVLLIAVGTLAVLEGGSDAQDSTVADASSPAEPQDAATRHEHAPAAAKAATRAPGGGQQAAREPAPPPGSEPAQPADDEPPEEPAPEPEPVVLEAEADAPPRPEQASGEPSPAETESGSAESPNSPAVAPADASGSMPAVQKAIQRDEIGRFENLLFAPTTPKKLDFREGRALCEQMERGGITDWRLPSLAELHRLTGHALPRAVFWSGTEPQGFGPRALIWSAKKVRAAPIAKGWSGASVVCVHGFDQE